MRVFLAFLDPPDAPLTIVFPWTNFSQRAEIIES
jgi:hypothetical protein